MCNLNRIFQGDCLIELRKIVDNFFDAVITDPPYGLSFMGKKWDYDVPTVEHWSECLRVLKPGGYLLAFAGTRTQHRMACNIEDAGFEIRDMIAWVYGSGFPKSLNIGMAIDNLQGNEREEIGITKGTGKQNPEWNGIAQGRKENSLKPEYILTKGSTEWEGWGTALKPALEPITVARKPLSEKTVAENVLKWGTGGMNIDECRIGMRTKNESGWSKTGNKASENRAMSGRNYEREPKDEIGTGRFPANFIHDGSDEVISQFPETKSGSLLKHHNRTGGTPPIGTFKIRDRTGEGEFLGDEGNASRFFYCAKASKAERNNGCDDLEERNSQKMGSGFKGTTTWTDDRRSRNNHPTVKPIALMEYLIKLVSHEKSIILDPFAGTGTTGIACQNLNREFLLIEKDPSYYEITVKRLDVFVKRMSKFNSFFGEENEKD